MPAKITKLEATAMMILYYLFVEYIQKKHRSDSTRRNIK